MALASAKYAIVTSAIPSYTDIDIEALPFTLDLDLPSFFHTNQRYNAIVMNNVRVVAKDDNDIEKTKTMYISRDLFKLLHVDTAFPATTFPLSSDLSLSSLLGSFQAKIWEPIYFNGVGWTLFGMQQDVLKDMFQNISFGLMLEYVSNKVVTKKYIDVTSEDLDWIVNPNSTARGQVASSLVGSFFTVDTLVQFGSGRSAAGKCFDIPQTSLLSAFDISIDDIDSDTDLSLYPIAYVGSIGAITSGRFSKMTDAYGVVAMVSIHRPATENILVISTSNGDSITNQESYDDGGVGWVGNYEVGSADTSIVIDIE